MLGKSKMNENGHSMESKRKIGPNKSSAGYSYVPDMSKLKSRHNTQQELAQSFNSDDEFFGQKDVQFVNVH